MKDEADRRRIRWLCRRGMKELDVLLETYLESVYGTLEPAERAAFTRLLQLEDPPLYQSLINGRSTGEAELDEVVADIRNLKRD